MRIGPDIIQSINENQVDISSGWAFTSSDAYSPDYKEVMFQPISTEATTLDYLRFKDSITDIIIRAGYASNSPILWSGQSFNISDNDGETNNTNSSVQQVSTGVVGDMAPAAVYGQGTISIESAHVNLRDNPGHVGSIITYLLTSASFTLTDGTEQYVVADYNNGNPIYRLENNKTNINSSNIVLIRVCWRNGVLVHSIDNDSAGSDLANKIEAAILQTTPYRKSLDGGLTISETSTPIARTVLMTPAVVYAGTFPHSLSAFNSSTNKLTFASVSNGVWSYTSGTTQYNNTQYNPATGLTTLGNNNYGVVWLYRSVGNDVEVFYVLGDYEYPSLAKAQTATLRSDLSLLLRDHCILCGRIIVQKGASSSVVENVSDVSFTSSQITIHNDLQNLQGGSAATSEYYHLSAATYNKLTSGFNPAVRGLFSGSAPIVYTSATGIFSHSTIGSAGTYTKVVTNATGHVTSGSVLTSADIPNLSATYITTNQKGVANGVASLDSNAKVPLSQLPATTIVDTFVVASSAAQLSLSAANQGDVCVRTDINKTYILKTDPYNVWGNWQEMLTPKDSVTSVFGRIGVITALSADYASFYAPIVHNQAWSTITSVPTASTSTSGVITSTDWNTFNNKASTTQLANYLPLSGGTLTGPLSQNGIATWQGLVGYESAVSVIYGGGVTKTTQNYGLGVQKDGTYTTINGTTGSMMAVNNTAILTVTSASVSIAKPTTFTSRGTQAGYTIWDAGNLTNLNQLTNGPGYLTGATGVNSFSIGPTTGTIVWYKIGTIGTVAAVGFGQAQLMMDSYANYNYSGNNPPWESIRFASRSSIYLDVRCMTGAGSGNVYGYVTNGTKLELWVKTTSTFVPSIIYVVNTCQGINASFGYMTNVTTEPSGITYVSTKTIYDDRYLQLAGGTMTGDITFQTTKSLRCSDGVWMLGYDGTYISLGSQATSRGFVLADGSTSAMYYAAGGGITFGKAISGTTAAFSSYASFNGASMPAWGANLNPIMLGGESFIYSYKVATGTQPTFGSNFYYDGTNLKVLGTYTNSNYPRALLMDNAGSLLYSTSITSPVAGTTITDLTTKFSISKEGNGTFSNSVFAPTISGTNTYGGKGLVKSAAIGFGAFFGTVDTGTMATTVGIIVDESSTQTYHSQKKGGNHSFYIDGDHVAAITSTGFSGVGNLSIANIGDGGIRLYGETVTGNGVVSLSPILKYGFSTIIANTGYVRFPVSILGAIVVINGKSYGSPITSTKATVQSGIIYPKGSGTVTTIDCDERRMFIGNGTDWFEV